MNALRNRAIALAALVLFAATATAGDDDKDKKKSPKKVEAKKGSKKSAKKGDKSKDAKDDGKDADAPPFVALTNAKVITVSGRTLRRGTVVIKDGEIHAVGEDVEVPEGATVVDCTGKTVCPGFIAPLVWGVGLGTGRFGFNAGIGESRDEATHDHHHHGASTVVDPHAHDAHAHEGCETCTPCDSCGGHTHAIDGPHFADGDVAYRADPSTEAHLHGSACVCADIDVVFRAQNLLPGDAGRLSLLARHPAQRVAAQLGASVGRAFLAYPPTAGRLLGVDPPDGAIKGELNPTGRDVMMMNAAGITTAWLAGTRAAPEFQMFFGAVIPPTAGTDGTVLKMARDRLDDMYVSSGRFLVMDLRPMTGLRRYKLLEEVAAIERYLAEKKDYDEALAKYNDDNKQYKADKKAKKKDLGPKPVKPKTVKKPKGASKWLPLVERKRALRVFADSVDRIRLALEITRRLGLELVIDGAAEGWAIAEEIGRANASVVLNPRRRLDPTDRPRNPRATIYRHGWSIENAAKLAAAGVRVTVIPPLPLLGSVGIPGRDLLTIALDAGFAVRGGLPRKDGLKAITLNAAELLGIADRTGSLDVGKDADVLVLDGDPFDHHTFVERAYVDGRLTYEKDAETLFDYVRRGRVVKPIWQWRKPPPGQETKPQPKKQQPEK